MTPSDASPQRPSWNGASGNTWVENQVLLDTLFAPIEARLAEEVAASGARSVLDVGCGTGATTLAAARKVGAEGRCLGVDLSEAMIALARDRATQEGLPAEFAVGDAQRHAFASGAFDLLISRFGVMFFDDFAAAFANLRAATREGGALRFVTWRSAEENPFMIAAESAAAPLLPALPPRDPDAPGQFGLADPDRTRRALEAGGWKDVALQSVDFACAIPEAGLLPYITRLGPVGQFLTQVDEATRDRVVAAMRPAFDPYVRDGEVRLTAACWMVSATA